MALQSSIPEDVLLHEARVTMIGRGCVMVEGQRGVVEMTDERIRLRTDAGVLSVLGSELRLKELSLDAAMIQGSEIMTVTYARAERMT